MPVSLFQRKKKLRRVSPDMARPMRRGPAPLESSVDPYERLLAVVLFAVGVVAVSAESGQRAAGLLGLTVLVFGLMFLAGRHFLKFQAHAVGDLRSLVTMLGMGLLVLLAARLTRDSEAFHPL